MTRDTQMDFMGEPASEHSAMMPIRAVVEHPHITPRTLDLTGSSRALGGRERLGNGLWVPKTASWLVRRHFGTR